MTLKFKSVDDENNTKYCVIFVHQVAVHTHQSSHRAAKQDKLQLDLLIYDSHSHFVLTFLSLTVIRDRVSMTLWDKPSMVSVCVVVIVYKGIFTLDFLLINVTIHCQCLMSSLLFGNDPLNGKSSETQPEKFQEQRLYNSSLLSLLPR